MNLNREARIAMGVLASTAMLYGARVAHSQEVSPDAEIESQLQAATVDDLLTLNNFNVGYMFRFAWVRNWELTEANVALITNDEGKFLAFAYRAGCIREALLARDSLQSTFFPGVYRGERVQSLEATTKVPEVIPTHPILRSEKVFDGDTEFDCSEPEAEDGSEDKLVGVIKKVDENLPDLAEGGARRVSSVARALYRGLTESR